MTDELRLGTLGDEILGGVLQTGATIPIPAFALGDDLPIPPVPLYDSSEPVILNGGISIPTP
jgi:hypothetical protein